MADLLAADFSLAEKDTLYRCLDKVLPHRTALFKHLRQRWEDLFGVKFQVLLYDLTSTYFESDPPFPEGDKRKFGYSRDQRGDCVQVVIALIVTPEGFPLAYEVMAGNTSDKTTLRGMLPRIEALYGQAERIWVMDRGIPTEEVLAEMRQSQPPIYYLVGTPKGRLSLYEQRLLEQPWQEVREGVRVKLLPQGGELYVLAQSTDRVNKERAIRRRQLKRLWQRLQELRSMKLKRDARLLKLGSAQHQWPAAWRLVSVRVPKARQPVNRKTFGFALRKDKPREVRRREGRYLLRSNLRPEDPAQLWQFYVQLTQVAAAPHLSLAGAADRGAHLCGLSGVLPAREFASAVAGACAGADAALGAGEVCGLANGQRAFPDHRRAGTGVPATHPAGERSEAALGPIGRATAAPVAAANHRQR
jgi:hypothetical protein